MKSKKGKERTDAGTSFKRYPGSDHLHKDSAAHPASFADFPSALHPDIRGYLAGHNIPRLYTHQTEMFEKAQGGENVVITTSTASGKTLSFLLPVLQEILTGSPHPGGLCISDQGSCGGSVPGASAVSGIFRRRTDRGGSLRRGYHAGGAEPDTEKREYYSDKPGDAECGIPAKSQ